MQPIPRQWGHWACLEALPATLMGTMTWVHFDHMEDCVNCTSLTPLTGRSPQGTARELTDEMLFSVQREQQYKACMWKGMRFCVSAERKKKKIMLKSKYHFSKWLHYLNGRVTNNHFSLLKGLTPLPAFSYPCSHHKDWWAALPAPSHPPSYVTIIHPAELHTVRGGFTQMPPHCKGGTPHFHVVASPCPQAGRLSGFLDSSNHIWGPKAARQ